MRKLYTFILVYFMISNAFPQTSEVALELNNNSFLEFVEAIESRTNYRFYFDPQHTTQLIVSIDDEATPFELTKQVLVGSGLVASELSNARIVITDGIEIRSGLPIGFFDSDGSTAESLDAVVLNFDKDYIEDEDVTVESQIIEIGKKQSFVSGRRVNLAGQVKELKTGEAVIGAMVYIEEPRIGAITDVFGYYNISLPQGKHTLIIRSVGLKETQREIILYEEGTLDLEMEDDIIALKEVVVEAEKTANVTGMQMGMEKLDIKKIKQLPSFLGENDIVRIALALPGVQTVGEGASGFNVRGGATDQNLILMNDAVVYNPSHFFGFFSIFNPDVVKSASLMKSGVPANYGGRVSSVFEVNTKDGNKRNFEVSGGISPVSARVTVEGPIINDKTSFIVGARSTYSDWLLNVIPDPALQNSNASFYDVSAKVSHEIGEKDLLSASGYFSNDKFQLFGDSVIQYQNLATSLQYKHVFNNKLVGVATGAYSRYQFNIDYKEDPTLAFNTNYQIETTSGKIDFSYFPWTSNKFDFGVSANLHRIAPGTQVPTGTESLISPIDLEPEKGLESAIYIADNFDINSRLSLYLGLRYTLYQYLGPKTVYGYVDGLPLSRSTISDTTYYDNNDVIKTYHGPEYRLSARYTLNDISSVKFSYNRMRQFINQLSNTTAIAPTDTWKLSDQYARPQVGDQFALGYYRNFRNNSIESSVEVYYKTVDDILDFKGGAQLLLNDVIETDLLSGFNQSYGVEFLLKKQVGKLDGWISYTYSRSLNRVFSEFQEETINNGDYYPANFDKPHSLNIIANYKFTRRFNISGSFVYSTGRPITYPVAKYNFRRSERVFYSTRNEFRIPDYFRLDLSIQIEGSHIVDKPNHSSWSFAVYNLLGRRNPYSVFFLTEDGQVNGYKLSVFGSAIPTVTYNFRFW